MNTSGKLLFPILVLSAVAAGAQANPPSSPVWRLSPSPVVTVGGAEHPEVEFLRIGVIQLRPDGLFLVSNSDPRELRLFNAQGILIRKVGREGAGPGEFRGFSWATTWGDSIVGYDFMQRRLTIFGPGDKVLPVPPLAPTLGSLALSWRLSCGSWLAQEFAAIDPPKHRGLVRAATSFVILTPSLDRVAHRLGPFPATTAVAVGNGRGIMTALFAATTVTGIAESLIYTMDTATPELQLWGCDGKRRRTLVVSLPERPVEPEVVRRLKERAFAGLSNRGIPREFIEARFAPENLPKQLPRVSAIFSGAPGELWLEQYEADPRTPSTWWILDLQGETLGTVRSPEHFRIKSALRDRIGGVYTDEDGVESVRIYRLIR